MGWLRLGTFLFVYVKLTVTNKYIETLPQKQKRCMQKLKPEEKFTAMKLKRSTINTNANRWGSWDRHPGPRTPNHQQYPWLK